MSEQNLVRNIIRPKFWYIRKFVTPKRVVLLLLPIFWETRPINYWDIHSDIHKTSLEQRRKSNAAFP